MDDARCRVILRTEDESIWGKMNEDAEIYELVINKRIFVDHPDMCALVVLMKDVSNFFIDIPTTRTITKTLAPTTSILTSSESTY